MLAIADDKLTARAPSSGGLVLGLSLFAGTVEGRLLAAGALSLGGADASSLAAAAGGGNGSGGRHSDVKLLLVVDRVG